LKGFEWMGLFQNIVRGLLRLGLFIYPHRPFGPRRH
jgi:hypothetical protein